MQQIAIPSGMLFRDGQKNSSNLGYATTIFDAYYT